MSWIKRIARAVNAVRLLVVNVLFIIVLAIIVAVLFAEDTPIEIPPGSTLVIEIIGNLAEEDTTGNSLAEFLEQGSDVNHLSVESIVLSLENALQDKRVESVLLNLEQASEIPITYAKRIGSALKLLQKEGKRIFAYSTQYSQGQYLLASYADRVYLHPNGQFIPLGYQVTNSYYKDFLDRFGINIHVFRAGKYKGAVEPFTRNSMSEESTNNNLDLINNMWASYLSTIADNRSLLLTELGDYALNYVALLEDSDGKSAALALKKGLIDRMISSHELEKTIAKELALQANHSLKLVSSDQYNAANYKQSLVHRESANNIAIINATGPIVNEGLGAESISARSLKELMRRAVNDPKIKALVVRINSPGGSAFASELIREELENIQEHGKPVVISMSNIAASGAYWIASTTDWIVAEPDTITGSIGIFGIVPTFEESLENIGISADGVGTSKLSEAFDPRYPLSESASRLLSVSISDGYNQFVELIVRGRELSLHRVKELATGKVWTGTQAKELGLVDQIGGIEDALAAAARLAKLDKYSIRKLETPKSTREMLEDLFLAETIQGRGSFVNLIRKFNFLVEQFDDPFRVYALCVDCQT